jgi:UPF0755 protein
LTVSYGEREPLTGEDPHSLLFGDDEYTEHSDAVEHGEHPDYSDVGEPAEYGRPDEPSQYAPAAGLGSGLPPDLPPGAPRRADRHHQARRRMHRRAYLVMVIVVVVVLAVVAYVGWNKYQDRYHPKNYSGAPGPVTLIKVGTGDGADAIGQTLAKAKVVASVRAFANAAKANSAAQNIQPGTYQVHQHLSAQAALAALLDPSARIANDAAVFEGATVFDVEPKLAAALHVNVAAVDAAIKNVAALNLPAGYTGPSGAPTSVEGFLYPATYNFDAGTMPSDALTQMITNFIAKDRSSHFAAQAEATHLTPYNALIIASIAVKEAKMVADYPKVARVILNRIAAHMPLQIDATSAYAAKLANLDPTKVIYATIDSPYNTYTHDGLPPTPISNPGGVAMNAAVHPAAGDWLYYVNSDAAGDLFFTNSDAAFEQAVQRCRDNHWGCG